jgi:hypothetical protein
MDQMTVYNYLDFQFIILLFVIPDHDRESREFNKKTGFPFSRE